MTKANGIDVSYAQSTVDWQAVKADGVEFAMLRAGFGWENKAQQTDAQFYANVKGAKAAGVPIGCYHYSYATTVEEAQKEAAFLLDIIKGYAFEYPVVFDIEDKCQRDLDKKLLTDIAIAFCKAMEKAGYYTAVYSNLDWIHNRLDMSRLARYDLWLAQYNENPTYTGKFGIWQCASDGKVTGINGNVDRDIAYKDYPAIIKAAGLNGYTKSTPAKPVNTTLKVGAKVQYAGYLYADSYGGGRGIKVNGKYAVNAVIANRQCGVLLPAGWVSAADCKVVG